MKKITAKLRLDTQTLKQLSGDALHGAAGGQQTASFLGNCGPSVRLPTAITCATLCACTQ